MGKILDAGRPIVDLDGKQIQDGLIKLVVGQVMGNYVMQSEGGDEVKLFILSKKLRDNKKVTVDDADYETLKKAVSEVKCSRLVKAQLQMVINEAKTVDDAPKKK